MRTVAEAWAVLTPWIGPPVKELRSRPDSLGRVLAEDLAATLDVPPTDVSAMDGFAARSSISRTSYVLGPTIAAGDRPGFTLADLAPDLLPRIMTGAPVPPDCTTVIPVEDARVAGDEVVITNAGIRGQHIRRQGEISRLGAPLLPRGTVLRASTLSLVATHGYDQIPVFASPTVAFATTGSEIVGANEVPGPGQIRDSHTDFLIAAVRALGMGCTTLGIVPDRADALRAMVKEGLKNDVFILSGGVSMGEFDLVEGILQEAGCQLLFDSVAIQPGKPVVAARHASGLVFGLPGNPASAQVTFWLFVYPTLRRWMGHPEEPWAGALSGRLAEELPGAKCRERYLPCEVKLEDGEALVTPRVPRGSHDVLSYGLTNALVRVEQGSAPRQRGDTCSAWILPA